MIYTYNTDGSFAVQIYENGLSAFITAYTGTYSYDSVNKSLTLIYQQKYSAGSMVNISSGDTQKEVMDSVGFAGNLMVIGVKGGNANNLQGTWSGTVSTYLFDDPTPTQSTTTAVITASTILINTTSANYSGLVMSHGKLTIDSSSNTNITSGGIANGDNYFAIADGVLSRQSTVADNISQVYIRQ